MSKPIFRTLFIVVLVSAFGWKTEDTRASLDSTTLVDRAITDATQIDPYADEVVDYEVFGNSNTHTDPSLVLGPPCKGTNQDLSLGGGWVIVDMGEGEEIDDVEGNDLRVYESEGSPYCNGGAASPYEVFVSSSPNGPWISIGQGSGVSGFDIGISGMDSVRYVKVEDRSSGQPDNSAKTPGADIAGFEAINQSWVITISHIEVTQVIQDVDNYVPLIANKPTFVRVFVECGEGCSSQPNVTGTLEVSSSAGSETFSPDMGAITAYHPDSWEDQRGDLKKTLNYYTIPTSLLTGTVTFTSHVGSASLSQSLPFTPGNKLRIAWVPILYQPNGSGSQLYYPETDIASSAWAYMSKIYPLGITDLEYFRQPVVASQQLISDSKFTPERAWNEYLKPLQKFWNITTQFNGWRGGQPDRLFGWISKQASVELDGMAYANMPEFKVFGTGLVAAGIANESARRTFAHEVGHLLGVDELLHAPCGTDDVLDPTYPMQEGLIDDWGINFIGTAPKLMSPTSAKDFMSYCGNAWISKYHYRKIVPGFQDFDDSGTKTLAEPQMVLVVSGEVFTPSLEVNFGTFYPLSSVTPPIGSQGSDYCLELRDINEIVLDKRCFDLSFTEPESGQPMDSESFVTTLPYPPGSQSVVLTHLGTELNRVTKSNAAPTVELTSPNGDESWSASGTYTITWNANDSDSDSLRFIISYSMDNGITWMPIAIDITGNSLTVDSQYLPGSTNARIKVTATDQMNSGEDYSDAPFAVGAKAPQPYILSPEQDTTIPPDTPIFMQGYAYDLEDGTIGDSSLLWSSNLDGDLGTGSTVLVSLSAGEHTIKLSTADSGGNSGSTIINVYVGYKIHLPLATK